MQELLKKYKEKNDELSNLETKNIEVFQKHDEISKELSDISEEIKIVTRKTLEDAEYENITVKFSRRFSSSYNWKKISEGTRSLLTTREGVTVVKKVFEDLVKEEAITAEERAKAFEEVEGTTAVSIKIN